MLFDLHIGAASQTVDPASWKPNMMCRVNGSPGYSVTHPTPSKCKPTGIALACAAGFFICAQPAIPAKAAPATNEFSNSFFIPRKSNVVAATFVDVGL